jgi:curved DNA-binding protein
MDFKDYYSTLGVAKTATEKEIKQAYRKLARKHHPDVNPKDKSAEAKFKEINEAYEVLGDPEKRKKYDELGANWRAYEQAGAQGGPGFGGFSGGFGGFDPRQQGGNWNVNVGGRPMTADELRDILGDETNPFSDFFQTFFGGADDSSRRTRGRAGRGPRQGRDVEHELELGLEDAFHGTTRRLSLSHGGQTRIVDVRIPAGIGDGSRVRVAGEGEQGAGGAKSGDLYLRIRVAPHGQFERKGRDLYTRVGIPLTTAVLGGEADVKTLGGQSLRLKIPPTTQNAQVFRLKGHGMPTTDKSGEHGDLYATVDVQLPRTLTPDQKKHFEELQKLESAGVR